MTEQLPPTSESGAETAPVESASGGRNIRGLVIGGIAVVVVAALAGGAFAVFKKLDGGGAQPHDVLPASVVAYARIDTDPSAKQKIAILRLVRKFPELAKELGIKDVDQDIRKPLLKDLVGECNLDYDRDVKPWIGQRIGIAYDAELETPVIAVQVSDEDKARTGITKLADCEGSDTKSGIAFLDGYALVTPRKADAAAISAAATKKPLADDATFSKDLDALGEQGVFSAWADLEGLGEIDELGAALGEDAKAAFGGASTTALTLRAGSSSLEIASISKLDEAPEVVKSTNIADLPADTALAFSISGLGDQVAEQFESDFLGELQGEGLDDDLADFEKEFGLKLPEDLQTLLGDGMTLAIGARNLETLPMLSSPQDVSQLDLGLKLATDPTKGTDLAQRLVDLAASVDIRLTATPADDGVVISTNPDAAQAFAGDGGLGKSKNFRAAIVHEGAYPAFFVDIDTILAALLDSNPPPDVEDFLVELEPLAALGASSAYEDSFLKATLRLTLD